MNFWVVFFIFLYLFGFGTYYSADLKKLQKKHYEYIIIFLLIFLFFAIIFKDEINMLP